MIKRRLGLINNNQRGYTLVELLVVITVAGLIASGVAMAIFQVVTGNARTSNHMTAVRQVQEAGYWVSQDVQMSEYITLDPNNDNGFPLTLRWQEWDDSIDYQVVYTLQNTELHRSYTRDGTVQSAGIIAEYIDSDSAKTNCNATGSEFIFTITAVVGSGSQQGSETRVYSIDPRPGL